MPSGLVTQLEDLEQHFSTQELDVTFVINERYTERIKELVEHARKSPKATGEPAYRLLQVLTRLIGDFQIR